MSRSRQPFTSPGSAPEADEALVRTFGLTFAWPSLKPPAVAGWDQLVHASRGVVTVRIGSDTWVLPPHRAMWIPSGVPFTLETNHEVALRSLYLAVGLSDAVPHALAVVNVSPLLRSIILRAVKLGALKRSVPAHVRLAGVLIDELEVLPQTPLQLPMPVDPRALKLAEALLSNPADDATLDRLVRAAGGSRRTLERIFGREVGISLGAWRQRMRLLHALARLAEGDAVTSVAADVGYASPSAFVAMFRRELGVTPKKYFE